MRIFSKAPVVQIPAQSMSLLPNPQQVITMAVTIVAARILIVATNTVFDYGSRAVLGVGRMIAAAASKPEEPTLKEV